jgi:hemerythrin-like domain-containing protein
MSDKHGGGSSANVMPIGPLMKEHRLIEQVIGVFREEYNRITSGKLPDTRVLGGAIEFFRFYADHCHHGKEENFFFAALEKKELAPEHRQMLSGLLNDHVRGRELVAKLETSLLLLRREEQGGLTGLVTGINELLKLYTSHIYKEDKQFFLPAMGYFSKEEQAGMLCDFGEFDRSLIHEKYQQIADDLKAGRRQEK